MPEPRRTTDDWADAVDVAIVGAGFAGMYMLYRVRELGLTAQVIERGDGVGGTWYWNRYPGARCDVESLEYSYSFSEELQQEWEWTERYSAQPEILRYANHVADRFDLRADIRFGTTVTAAHWHEERRQWDLHLADSDSNRDSNGVDVLKQATVSARFVVTATGCLSSVNKPQLPGLDRFEGRVFHTGEWPHHDVDFGGRRVGVVGTGSSAIQAVPEIAKDCSELLVFQRTPAYSVPARNRALDPNYERRVKDAYHEFRAANRRQPSAFGAWGGHNDSPASAYSPAEQAELLEEGWDIGGFRFARSFSDTILNEATNKTVGRFVVDKIHQIVDDPQTAAALSPSHTIACKRLCLDTNYFETYNLDHVSLIDIATNPIGCFDATGVELADGRHVELDDVVMATGFDAMTGALLNIDIEGRDGQTLRSQWADGPRTYLGLMVPDIPNLFMVTGPGSPSVLTNMIVAIEQHVEWIARCVGDLTADGFDVIAPSDEAADEWVAHVNEVADRTLMRSCNSWYVGANVEGKPRVFMPLIGFPTYADLCDDVAHDGYRGFERRPVDAGPDDYDAPT